MFGAPPRPCVARRPPPPGVCVDLTTSAPTSVFQPQRVKVPEMLQAEIGKLAPGQFMSFWVHSCAGPSGWGTGKGRDAHSPRPGQLLRLEEIGTVPPSP